MKRMLLYLFIVLMPGLLKAQLTENFADGDFTSNPEWIGDSPQYKVNMSFQLQLNSSGDNTSCLATACALSDSMEWNFWVKLAFSPSDNNLAKIYLVSDHSDLENALNGYYLKLGESGSADAIELVKQTGNIHTSLCRGTPGMLASSFAVRIRVIRSATCEWKLFADATGGTDYMPEGTASDNTFSASSWFGIVCKYTSSNSTKYYFDDIYAGPVLVDDQPPQIQSVSVFSPNSLKIQFNEKVDSASACNPANYLADQGIGQPAVVQRDPTDHTVVMLAFPQDFALDIGYNLKVDQVKDLAGNRMLPVQFPFIRHEVKAFDVVINEMMIDPEPVVGLPGFEYLELFNRSSSAIDLSGWSLITGSSVKQIPSCILPAGGYVIVSDDAAETALQVFGPVLTFSSFSLVNTGTTVVLRDEKERIIHSVSYTDDWYRNDYKKEGGWSLELIDPANSCGDRNNWKASNDISGGTPGRVNSVNALNPDHQLPAIVRIGITNRQSLTVTFSEPMDSTTLSDPMNYTIDNGTGNPLAVHSVAPSFRQVNLDLASSIIEGTIYTLTLSGTFSDCAGNNILVNSSARFAIPVLIEPGSLVINEVLFDPAVGCVDFVEIYNRSSGVYDLKDLTLAAYDTAMAVLSSVNDVSAESYLIFPGDYQVLTTDTAAVLQCYSTTNPGGFIEMSRLPAMNTDAGSIAIALKTGTIIDRFTYTADMQYPLLIDTKGVSLERINPERPSGDISNWHSAAGSAGFATPACKNSQFGMAENSSGEISLSPAIFSPDNDGYNDILNIAYTFSNPGYNATISIYDASGHLVRNLVNNELCGTSGSYSWDGITNDRVKAPIGRYLIFVEIFDLQGNVKHFKKATVLGGKL